MGIREDILAEQDQQIEAVSMPEWKTVPVVHVKKMSGLEHDAYQSELLRAKQENEDDELRAMVGHRSRFLVFAICDEKGNQIFAREDVEALGKKSTTAIDRIYEVAARLNRVREEDKEQLVRGFTSPDSGSS